MADKKITLAVAAFLDSPRLGALDGVPERDVRAVLEPFLRACYEVLGVEPRLLDGDGLREVLVGVLPAEFRRKEGVHRHVPDVLAAWLDHLEETATVPQAFEMRLALDAASAEFLERVERGGAERVLAPAKQESVVHRAAKLGRNDPCFCGSGRKFKKCHGRDA